MATDMRTAGPQPAPVAVASASTRLESRRLLAEAVGTFFLVLVAAEGAVVNAVSYAQVGPAAAAAAAGPDGAGVIYTIGETSGAHLNPAVTMAFAAGATSPSGGFPVTWPLSPPGRRPRCAACSAPPTGWVMETVSAPAAPPALVGRPGRRFPAGGAGAVPVCVPRRARL
jgi:hypothetical protein